MESQISEFQLPKQKVASNKIYENNKPHLRFIQPLSLWYNVLYEH